MGRKHLEKEKLLVMRNFSFSHSVFRRLVQQTCKNQGLFGKGLFKVVSTIPCDKIVDSVDQRSDCSFCSLILICTFHKNNSSSLVRIKYEKRSTCDVGRLLSKCFFTLLSFLCPGIDSSGSDSFWPIRLSVCPQKLALAISFDW